MKHCATYQLEKIQIETPVCPTEAPVLAGKKLTFISVLRAGDGLLGPMLELVPSARVGQIGLARDEETLQPTKYFFKVPKDISNRLNVVLDPMLATRPTPLCGLFRKMKDAGANDLRFVCLLAAPEGIETFTKAHPDVPVVTASIDERLNEKAYIVPGPG